MQQSNLTTAVTLIDNTFVQWGPTMSTKETKVLTAGRDVEVQPPPSITIISKKLEVVSSSSAW